MRMTDRATATLARVSSGIPGLDTILGGGFLKGGLYIVQGPPGTGKTTFGNQVCFNHVAGGGRALYVTLLAEYHGRMMQHLGVMAFFDPSKIPDQLVYLNGLGTLQEGGLKALLGMLRREIAARSALMLVLDGIVSLRRMAANEQAFNEFVHDLQAIAIATDCSVFMLTSAQSNVIEPEHTMVDGIIELIDELTGWSAASSLQVVKLRGSGFLRGRHAYKISENGITVHPRIEALLSRPSQSDPGADGTVSSGTAQLDVMLGGGLPEASTTMVMGPSGTGKTTLGLHFLAGCSKAEPGLLFGFYETPARIDAKIAGVCHPLRGSVDSGAVEVLWQPPTDDLLDAYGDRLLQAVRRRKVRRLFIDGLGGFQAAASSGGVSRIGMFLTALMNEMRVLGVTTVYTLEVPDIMGPTIRTSIGDLSSLAENLIMLRFVEVGSQLHRLISVLKVRDSQFDQSLHEYATSGGGLLIEPGSDSAQRIMLGYSRQMAGEPPVGEQPRAGRGG
jgi:circadian clock protein KaiC